MSYQDLTGKTFGRLRVIEFAKKVGYHRLWRSICECGNECISYGQSLRNGRTQSCGCLLKERSRASVTTHNMSYSPEYRAWRDMIHRCTNPSNPRFHHYGGRGIQVHLRWKESFSDFYADMGPRPGKGYSIERKNNDGNYEPDNCCWATWKEQSRNTRHNRLITIHGRTQTLIEWAEESNLSPRTLWGRLEKWPPEIAISSPLCSGKRPF